MRIGSHFFAYLSRMRFIQRWALMRNTAPENVQEHSHQVAVLAHALAVIRNEKFGGHAACTPPAPPSSLRWRWRRCIMTPARS